MNPMVSTDYIALEDQYGARNYKPIDVVAEKADGVWVYDVEGKKYLDCLSAYSAVNQGHCNPKILEAFIEQAKTLTLTSRAFRNSTLPLFEKEICELSGYEAVLPMNTGAEAVETAIKMARKWGYTKKGVEADKAEIITCSSNFHGRTTTIVSFSTSEESRNYFGPFTPGFKVVKYGDIEEFKANISTNTCAFLVEPIQGEGGVIIPTEGYLQGVKKVCEENNILLIVDEIQTGFGRTGKLFAYEHEGIKPDAITVGKALSGGFYPVSALLASKELMSVFQPGQHGSTYGGNPLGCAAARAAMKVLIEDGLIEKAAELGEYFMDKLKTINSSEIKEVRGKGLFIAIDTLSPARKFCEALKEKGVLCKETRENTIRIAPPLVITKDELDFAFEKFKEVLGE